MNYDWKTCLERSTRKWRNARVALPVFFLLFVHGLFGQDFTRMDISLNEEWFTIAGEENMFNTANGSLPSVNSTWKPVDIPHNWDGYEGYRRLVHGNRHGDSWYSKHFSIKQSPSGKRFFLFFEGVGSYATVYLNGSYVGSHAGGRTTFTLDATNLIRLDGKANELLVRAFHPAGIQDLPWVCGGCSSERGFSEGSQPMGIFRPVHLLVTSDIRVEPFGVHAWAELHSGNAMLHLNTTVKNYGDRKRTIQIRNQLLDATGKQVSEQWTTCKLNPGDSLTDNKMEMPVNAPVLWSLTKPYLYKIKTTLVEQDRVLDEVITDFGFRSIHWKDPSGRFMLNGEAVFINGVAEYEHLLGQSHAFSREQILSRMKWLKFAGFNAFRDGHQPHNLEYGKLCNEQGILWWTQLSAHIWYDNPAFRSNFKSLLREWVIERRNDPAVVLWGLQNESRLPEDFARECTELIRELDPTASGQRLVTTCNGGSGTDWDVPQNWTGTYGGDPDLYDQDLKKQILVGEYGAWRTLGLHSEGGFVQNGILSEDRMTELMEKKVRLAESARDSSAGHFFWLLTSHDNPGRVQGGEGLRELDRIGPVNYKGLLTPWEEPLDVFYMFRSNYASREKEPMVYIASHTWPGRWTEPGIKDGITVYSNCEEVELFNDLGKYSLGKKTRKGAGTSFHWNQVFIQFNVLYAVGFVQGREVARDTIVLHHLPEAPGFSTLFSSSSITNPEKGYQYHYRVNCGGPGYRDSKGNYWEADRNLPEKKEANTNNSYWGSSSWTSAFPGIPAFFASQRRTFDPVKGTGDWKLFQHFRYGKEQLQYDFPVPDGEYLVELYFIEPWLGVGGGMDATGMRLFDIDINGKRVIRDLDIWKEAGTLTALKIVVKVKSSGGKLRISFHRSKAGQALISAIAIASRNKKIKPAKGFSWISDPGANDQHPETWLDLGDRPWTNEPATIRSLPSILYGADWIRFENKNQSGPVSFTLNLDADIFLGIPKENSISPVWLEKFENTKEEIITDEKINPGYKVYRRRYEKMEKVELGSIKGMMVMIRPVSDMQPAYDLKPTSSYKTNVAMLSDGVTVESRNDRESAVVKNPGPQRIEWPIQTGVADIYSITLKYHFPGETKIKARIRLVTAAGTTMMNEEVDLEWTRPGKWNQVTVNTGSMINAGDYKVVLEVQDAIGLAVSGIDLQ